MLSWRSMQVPTTSMVPSYCASLVMKGSDFTLWFCAVA